MNLCLSVYLADCTHVYHCFSVCLTRTLLYTGLSYTSFKYHNLITKIAETANSAVMVSVDITNTGPVSGADIPQLYLGFPSEAGEPPKQLKSFKKTQILEPGATTTVHFSLVDRDLSIWDDGGHMWSKQTGTFQVFVGASSEDIRVTGTLHV